VSQTIPFTDTPEYAAIIAALGDKAKRAVVRVFTESGTWAKPEGLVDAYIVCIGGGGGGWSGSRLAYSGSVRGGARGGGGGAWSDGTFGADALGEIEEVIVGAGGTGAPGAMEDDSSGAAGTAGGASSFGSLIVAGGGPTSGAAVGGVSGQIGNGGFSDGSQSIMNATTQRPGGLAPGGGASGMGFHVNGEMANSTSPMIRGNGGYPGYGVATSDDDQPKSAPLTPGGHGASAGDRAPGDIRGAFGGAGGSSNVDGPGGNGGNGGFPGGGGGGGGASNNGFTSGAGGDGANGVVIVVECC